jgi:hypothetical protein
MDPMDPDPDPQHCLKGRSPLFADRCVKDTIDTRPFSRKAISQRDTFCQLFNRHSLEHLVEIITIVSTFFRIPGNSWVWFRSLENICLQVPGSYLALHRSGTYKQLPCADISGNCFACVAFFKLVCLSRIRCFPSQIEDPLIPG